MAATDPPLEGFLCPVCLADFPAPAPLTKHFDEFHRDDPEIFKSLKDLFGKAKSKILKREETSSRSFADTAPRSPPSRSETGTTRSHTAYFRQTRNARLERYSAQTNKLLIRLDKLLNDLPTDPVDRKAHERAVVPWIDDKDVKLCPICAKSFHVARRKHHCRLCGAVMCRDCTVFLSLRDASR
ncbi:unnamed protein product [Heterotrigona itama]|uniref:FYVE-type domain-containing protein n=1 Tax=Heterotrigona itama TaxID=395501 RepID=A0A6V7HGN0_9HYME|nr:unnamed protein product [Heterotrigona itama]